MADALGHYSYAAIGDEASYGGGVSCTHRLDIIGGSMELVRAPVRDKNLYNARSRRGAFRGPQHYRGRLSFRANYSGMLKLWHGVLPTTTSVAVDTTARDHTFKEAAAGVALPSKVLELIRGNVVNGRCERYVGVSIMELTSSGQATDGDDSQEVWEGDFHARDAFFDKFVSPYKRLGILCGITNGSAVITRSSGNFTNDGVKVGDVIEHAGFPDGTTVASIDTATQITADQNATQTVASTVVTYTAQGIACNTNSNTNVTRDVGSFITDGVQVGDAVTGSGVAAGTTVTVVNSATQITLSLATSSTLTDTPLTFTHPSPSIHEVLSCDLITLDDGTDDAGDDISFKSWKVTIAQPSDLKRYEGGSLLPRQPLPSDFLAPTIEITKRYRTSKLQKVAKAGTLGSPKLVWRHPTKIGATNAANREFELRMNNAFIPEGYPRQEIAGYGEIDQVIMWEGLKDDADATCIAARIRNLETVI